MTTVKIVTRVERTLCSNLRGMLRTGAAAVRVPEGVEWEQIAARQHPQLTISEKVDDGVPIYTATLRLLTCQQITDRRHYAYRLTLVGGRQLLIGTDRKPYPVLTIQEQMPEKPADNSWNEAAVTWSAQWQIPHISA